MRAPGRSGTSVTLLGTSGGPVPVPSRAMAAQVVHVAGCAYLIDCGAGALRRLVDAEVSFRALRALLITHLHADHVSDYFATIAAGKPFGPGEEFARPLQVHGPIGASALHSGVLDAFARALETQYAASSLGPGLPDIVEVHEIEVPPTVEPFEVYADEHVRVTAALADHPPIDPCFAFRFDTADGAVVFSGDGRPSANVVRLAQGADLLVHEAMHAQAMLDCGTPEPFVRMLRRSHTDVTEVGTVAREAGVGQLVLSHLIPLAPGRNHQPAIEAESWLAPARADYDGPVTLGADLMSFALTSSTA
jgi:ribonuclease BN (tRNA processing enzyme)